MMGKNDLIEVVHVSRLHRYRRKPHLRSQITTIARKARHVTDHCVFPAESVSKPVSPNFNSSASIVSMTDTLNITRLSNPVDSEKLSFEKAET